VTELIPFSKLFKVSDQSRLCNLKSIVTDEMISACAKVGQNCKNSQIESEIDSFQIESSRIVSSRIVAESGACFLHHLNTFLE